MTRRTERLSRDVAGWPARDRAAWHAARQPSGPLDDGGLAAGWSPKTIRQVEKGYGLWLGCLARHGLLERQGWTLEHTYSDRAMSGASMLRPGYQRLLADARDGQFEVVVAEALDRLSRDQEDTAALYKRLRFANVALVTLAEGEITDLHVGLKGTMNALFLKDLADKTRRGLRGRVEAGKSGGGNA
jgi:DNA invertase Pin-like site-specific DNA recombinase